MKYLLLTLLLVGCDNTPDDLKVNECVELVSSTDLKESEFYGCATQGLLSNISFYRHITTYYVKFKCTNGIVRIATSELKRCK